MRRPQSLPKLLLPIVIASLATSALAQKSGGTLRVPLSASPSSGSLHEESAANALRTFMAVYNNLVIFDQQEKITRPETIRPDLATGWSWSPDNLSLTFKLREGVKWHDGKPFTSADVTCTWDMIQEKRPSNWRKNSHKEWYHNLKDVTALGPYEVRFTLARPQPAFLSLLAAGWSAVYPCHVDGATMRRAPIGTGPFKFVEWKANDVIRLAKNRDYWKPGRPYLDAIELRIMPSQATRLLSFVSGVFDVTGTADVTVNTRKDILAQAPKALCDTTASNIAGVLLINHNAPPFDNPKVQRAISLAIYRREFLRAQQGNGFLGGIMMPAPYGVWGLTPEQLEKTPGFSRDVERNRAQARKLMAEAGYGPANKLKTTYYVRLANTPGLVGGSLIADQLRTIYIEGEVEPKEYTLFTGALIKGAYTLAFEMTGAALDDPDVAFYEGYTCASIRNYTKYCNREVEAKIDEQSATVDPLKRKQLVQALDLKLQQDVARPILYQQMHVACRQPYVKGYVKASNGNYTHHRMEDVWIDK